MRFELGEFRTCFYAISPRLIRVSHMSQYVTIDTSENVLFTYRLRTHSTAETVGLSNKNIRTSGPSRSDGGGDKPKRNKTIFVGIPFDVSTAAGHVYSCDRVNRQRLRSRADRCSPQLTFRTVLGNKKQQ